MQAEALDCASRAGEREEKFTRTWLGTRGCGGGGGKGTGCNPPPKKTPSGARARCVCGGGEESGGEIAEPGLPRARARSCPAVARGVPHTPEFPPFRVPLSLPSGGRERRALRCILALRSATPHPTPPGPCRLGEVGGRLPVAHRSTYPLQEFDEAERLLEGPQIQTKPGHFQAGSERSAREGVSFGFSLREGGAGQGGGRKGAVTALRGLRPPT